MIIIIVMIIMMMFIAKVTDFDYEGTRQESHSNPWGTGDQVFDCPTQLYVNRHSRVIC